MILTILMILGLFSIVIIILLSIIIFKLYDIIDTQVKIESMQHVPNDIYMRFTESVLKEPKKEEPKKEKPKKVLIHRLKDKSLKISDLK